MLKFVDLFCGIGGFNYALKSSECVFASDIDEKVQINYNLNHKIMPFGDIKKIKESHIPKHNILCGGFPCQSFSHAGKQNGFNDTRGTLFFEIERILKYHKPKYILLENVRNLVTHDSGNTWKVIKTSLNNLGYTLPNEPLIVNPITLGIPQNRPRVIIPGVLNLKKELIIDINQKPLNPIQNYLEEDITGFDISKTEEDILNIWDEFYKGIKQTTIGFPIWFDCLNDNTPYEGLPDWKISFILKNNDLYLQNKEFIDSWKKKYNNLENFTNSQKKFEWQAGEKISSVFDGIIQFRPSGIRVKAYDYFPAFVAMAQIPIIGKLKRRLTPKECANLQSFPKEYIPNNVSQQAYKDIGNAVNVEVIKAVWNELKKY